MGDSRLILGLRWLHLEKGEFPPPVNSFFARARPVTPVRNPQRVFRILISKISLLYFAHAHLNTQRHQAISYT